MRHTLTKEKLEAIFMQHLRELLAMDDSLIAWLLSSRLREIEDFLKEVQAKLPQDSGAKVCDAVLQEFQSLLQLTSFDGAANQSQDIAITPKQDSNLEDTQPITSPPSSLNDFIPTDELKLIHLRDAFQTDTHDKDLIKYLGDFQLDSKTDSDLWNEIQHKLLRLPKGIAKSWKERILEIVQKDQAEIDISNIVQLCFNDNEDIYPGLKGTVQAQGLSLSKSKNALLNLPFLPRDKYENLSDDLKLLACLVSICIFFIDTEPDLHHALETVYKFNVIHLPSNPEECKKYIEALTERFQRTLKAEESGDSLAVLKAWISVDEAIHSLVFVPPADNDSWWGELKKQSRRILTEKVKKAKEKGYDVRIRELSGVYADIHKFSSKDYNLPLKVGGIPGEVQACLRVYARINNEVFPGRVIFRSLQ